MRPPSSGGTGIMLKMLIKKLVEATASSQFMCNCSARYRNKSMNRCNRPADSHRP